MAMMARKFKKFLRNNGNSRSRESKNSVNPSHEVKCYECGGVGHRAGHRSVRAGFGPFGHLTCDPRV